MAASGTRLGVWMLMQLSPASAFILPFPPDGLFPPEEADGQHAAPDDPGGQDAEVQPGGPVPGEGLLDGLDAGSHRGAVANPAQPVRHLGPGAATARRRTAERRTAPRPAHWPPWR